MNRMFLPLLLLSFAFLFEGCQWNKPPPPTELDEAWDGLSDTVIGVGPAHTIVSLRSYSPPGFMLLADRPVHVWLWQNEWIGLGIVDGNPVSIDSSISSYLAMSPSDGRPVNVALQRTQAESIMYPIKSLIDVEALSLSAKGELAESVLDQMLEWLPLELEESDFLAEFEVPTGDDQVSRIATGDGLVLRSMTRSPKQGDATLCQYLTRVSGS